MKMNQKALVLQKRREIIQLTLVLGWMLQYSFSCKHMMKLSSVNFGSIWSVTFQKSFEFLLDFED